MPNLRFRDKVSRYVVGLMESIHYSMIYLRCRFYAINFPRETIATYTLSCIEAWSSQPGVDQMSYKKGLQCEKMTRPRLEVCNEITWHFTSHFDPYIAPKHFTCLTEYSYHNSIQSMQSMVWCHFSKFINLHTNLPCRAMKIFGIVSEVR